MNLPYEEILTRGMEREKTRLAGSAFITLTYNRDLDYDGFTESLELLDGFTVMAEAIQCVDQLANEALAESLEKLTYKDSKWRHDESKDNAGIMPNHEGLLVRRIHLRSFLLTDDSMYNTKQVLFEVLCATLPEAIGPELFAYYDEKAEWEAYFVSKGR
jgi:hypothetical protein